MTTHCKKLTELGYNSENLFKISRFTMREKDSLFAKLKLNAMTKNKFNTMIEMLKYMDVDDKSGEKKFTIKKPASRNSSLTRQDSKKEVKPQSLTKSTINVNPSPYDPRNLTSSKNSNKRLTTFKNSSSNLHKLSGEKDINRQSFSSNGEHNNVDEQIQTNND